jgi:predicted dehydrogenase
MPLPCPPSVRCSTPRRPRLEVICASATSAEKYRNAYRIQPRCEPDWQELVEDPRVEAIVIASPQTTHRAIAEAAFALGKPVFCEKPLGASLEDARAMVAAAEAAGVVNMIGFNYMRTPATQFARSCSQRVSSARHVVPRRAYRGFPRRPDTARQLAHDRAMPTAPWAILPRT